MDGTIVDTSNPARTNMLEDMTTTELIEFTLENPESSLEALELATRLQYAVDELDRMTNMIARLEVPRGEDIG